MIIALVALATGAALLTHILAGVSLAVAVLVALALVLLAVGALLVVLPPRARRQLGTRIRVGALCGLAATVAYDASKAALSVLDPSPYNPFHAITQFGQALTPEGAAPWLTSTAGVLFHTCNGIGFGIAFASAFGKRGALAGVLWGLGLELFQLSLYPGWLSIRFFDEFVVISSLGHVVYGAVLGLGCRRMLIRASA